MHKLKILGEGQLEYYKPMKGTTKKKGDQIFKFQVIFGGKAKEGNTIFDSNLVGGKIFEENMVYFWKNLHQKYIYKIYLNKTNTIYKTFIHKMSQKLLLKKRKMFFQDYFKIILQFLMNFSRFFNFLEIFL